MGGVGGGGDEEKGVDVGGNSKEREEVMALVVLVIRGMELGWRWWLG